MAGDAHLAACHYAEELAEVTVESLRETVDVTPTPSWPTSASPQRSTPDGEPGGSIIVGRRAVAEGAAHPGHRLRRGRKRPGPRPRRPDEPEAEVNP